VTKAIVALVFVAGLGATARAEDRVAPVVRPVASHPAAAPVGAIAPVSFRNQVIPVLTKAGCNSGACHGAAAGKNGFGLTLRGYDPMADYETITRQAGGRRVNKIEPAKSLILLKPTETVPHVGGRRFTVDSPEYRVLSSWIASGMRAPREADPRLARIDVAPGNQTLAAGVSVPLTVTAYFTDGSTADVTHWAKYGTADETVAHVDDDGRVTVKGPGETAVAVSFLTGVALARVRSPFPVAIPETTFASAERFNPIDEPVLAKLQELHIPPSPVCTDNDFIRRAFLDAAGTLPTRAEVDAFVADSTPDKRARLVDALFERDEFVDYWAYKWSDLLLVSSRSLGRNNVKDFYSWIRAAVKSNMPWDRLVYALTTATGRTDENGAANYYLIHRSPIDLAENYTQAFLGLTLTCARCHNHPMEKWTQVDYYGFANLFARVSVKEDDSRSGKSDTATVFSTPAGDVLHPRLGIALAPRPLDGKPMAAHSSEDRREYLARWATSPENTLFARAIVNRVWANYFGRGLVHPMDDLRFTNPASNEPLLASVTADFVRHGFDLRWLMREIMTSAAYQRSSATVPDNVKDDRFYSHYLIRRLPAEVILDAFSQVTGVPESFASYSKGTRALQLPDTRVDSYFLTVFGRPERIITSAAERMQDPTLPQALHAINGDTLNKKLMADAGVVARMAQEGTGNADAVESLYLAAFSRPPTAAERDAILQRLGTASSDLTARRAQLEDLAWALLTSREFLFNH
jgi:uncharacterized protein DUF1549/uncharacterized protein DUF1553/Big-like domain-containing protein